MTPAIFPTLSLVPVTAMEDVERVVERMVDGQGSRLPALAAAIPGADRAVPFLPERHLLPCAAARHVHAGKPGEGLRPFRGFHVDAAVDVADAHGDRLAALEGPAVGVLAVPGEGVRLIQQVARGRRPDGAARRRHPADSWGAAAVARPSNPDWPSRPARTGRRPLGDRSSAPPRRPRRRSGTAPAGTVSPLSGISRVSRRGAPRNMVALVVEAERGPRHVDHFTQPLAGIRRWNRSSEGPALPSSWETGPVASPLGWAERPVVVHGCEVRELHAKASDRPCKASPEPAAPHR